MDLHFKSGTEVEVKKGKRWANAKVLYWDTVNNCYRILLDGKNKLMFEEHVRARRVKPNTDQETLF